MKIDEILEVIASLAGSQGFYSRLFESLMDVKQNQPEYWEELVKQLEAQDFKDALDVVLYFEG